jgi:HAD superfamily hydrolase (TIGR01509 family)
MIQGVLFDMDGVLVDSEEFICQAATEMFREKGLEVQAEDFKPFVGAGENRYIGGVAEKYNLPVNIEDVKSRTYQIYREIVRDKLAPLDGVIPFIEKCKAKGFRIAVASSADDIKVRINLKEIGLPPETFDGLVNGDMIEHLKPAPDIFLQAAYLIDCKPENCLVVEDAVNGVVAGKKAGAKVLALTTSFSKKDLQQADWIAEDLANVPEGALDW